MDDPNKQHKITPVPMDRENIFWKQKHNGVAYCCLGFAYKKGYIFKFIPAK